MPRLTFREADRELFVHRLHPGQTLVGRSDKCDVALPDESVSRTHFSIERRTEGWYVVDRSRHGTLVNDRPVDRHHLAHGDEIRVGVYTATFSLRDEPQEIADASTVTPVAPAIHEDLLALTERGFAAAMAELQFVGGPLAGTKVLLVHPRTTLGGRDAEVVLDPSMPASAVRIRVVRGRAMIEPAAAAAILDGERVREITPLHPSEEVRVGEHVFTVVARTVEQESDGPAQFGEMVGKSKPMRVLFGHLQRVAAHNQLALLTGESGTGKELAARAIHAAGTRRDGPFVAVNCAAIADTLVESELFGHEKGAFTGAAARQDGAFQQADGGTLFLDEIGELRLEAQAKLLRALESGEVRRVGGTSAEFPDVRVIAATHRNLADMVKKGQFRADLYFRLTILPIKIPPLRERREDVPAVAKALLQRNHPGAVLTEDGAYALQSYEWPGNVRELKNVLTRAVVMGGPVVSAASIAFHPWAFDGDAAAVTLKTAEEEAERRLILETLANHKGNRARAAVALGIARSTLLYKMRKLGIDVAN